MFPNAVEFGDAPGLCSTTALGVWRVAVENFGEVADATVFE